MRITSKSAVVLLAVAAAAGCGGSDVSLGKDASGDGNAQGDGQGGGDSQQGTDAPGDSNNPYDGSQGGDSGADSGMCMPKNISATCGNLACNAEANFCFWIRQVPMCTPTPSACKCNYTCQCVLANLPPNNCSTAPMCQALGNGQISVTCY